MLYLSVNMTYAVPILYWISLNNQPVLKVLPFCTISVFYIYLTTVDTVAIKQQYLEYDSTFVLRL